MLLLASVGCASTKEPAKPAPILSPATTMQDAGMVDIRAVGMLAAVEVAVDGTPGARGHEMQKRLFDAGVNIKSTGDNLIIAPPFISEKSHIDHVVSVMRDVLAKA